METRINITQLIKAYEGYLSAIKNGNNYNDSVKPLNEFDEKKHINEVIKAGNGAGRLRTIDYYDIISATQDFVKKVGIAKKALAGTRVRIDIYSQVVPNSYLKKGKMESTQFTIEFDEKNCYLVEVMRRDVRKTRYTIATMSDSMKTAIIEKYTQFD